jgi:hypothetical protein
MTGVRVQVRDCPGTLCGVLIGCFVVAARVGDVDYDGVEPAVGAA